MCSSDLLAPLREARDGVVLELGTARMDSALAASKYHSIPGFAERRKGHIVLQDHGDEVYFRSIKVRVL